MWRRLLAIAGWALPQPSANLNPMPSVARLSRACAVRPGRPAQLRVMCSPSQRLAAWWLGAIARTGKGGSFVSRGVPCRVVGTSRRLRLLRLPTSGTGDGFPRHALLITAGGYCSVSIWQAHERGAPLLLPPAGRGRSSVSCDQVRAVIGSSWFCAACGSRLSGRQLPFPRAVETMSAPSEAK